MATLDPFINMTNTTDPETGGGINIPGLAGIIVFYLAILCVGLWAAWRRKGLDTQGTTEEVMLAGRNIGPMVGVLTMTATWVGGGYINGTAEAVFSSGLVYCQAPFGYTISVFLGGLFFARKMRDARYITMLDPLQECYGTRWGAMLFLPALAGETLWSASILAALGSTLAVILDIGNTLSIIVSATIAVCYTLFGGLYSVAYTDVVQLFCIFIGLWITIPFAIMNDAVSSLDPSVTDWVGSVDPDKPWHWGEWADYAALMIMGGIPWQVYFQRVLSAKTSKQAQVLSYAGALGCFIMAVPALLIGIIAKATNWEQTDYRKDITEKDQMKLVLPLVMQYLTPPWVAFLGLGAVSAAVMSSADSSVLSSSSMFANNIYKNVIRRRAGDKEIMWVMRVSVICVASIACVIAIRGNSIYELFYLCSDLVYVMLFPQLLFAVHYPTHVNTYGSITAYVIGLLMRLLGGEPVLGLPAVIKYPYYENDTQYFPFRTLSMLVTLVILLFISWVTRRLNDSGHFRDFLGVFDDEGGPVVAVERVPPSHKNGIDNPGMQVNGERNNTSSGYPDLEMERF